MMGCAVKKKYPAENRSGHFKNTISTEQQAAQLGSDRDFCTDTAPPPPLLSPYSTANNVTRVALLAPCTFLGHVSSIFIMY